MNRELRRDRDLVFDKAALYVVYGGSRPAFLTNALVQWAGGNRGNVDKYFRSAEA